MESFSLVQSTSPTNHGEGNDGTGTTSPASTVTHTAGAASAPHEGGTGPSYSSSRRPDSGVRGWDETWGTLVRARCRRPQGASGAPVYFAEDN